MDNTKESPTILSICTGIRGLERGIERVIGPFRIAAYVEIEAFACWNLVAAMESGFLDPTPIWTDVKTFPSQHFRGKVHGIIGGYPCQPFSNAGNRKGEEDPRHLWPFIEQQISTIRPLWCFFENVAGHLTLGFQSVRCSLEEMGYRVEAGIYSAEEVGSPHRRERLFILAMAHSNHKDARGRDREIPNQAAKAEGQTQGENGERMRSESACSCENVVNTACIGQRKSADQTIPFTNDGESRQEPCERCNDFQSLAAGVGQRLEGQWLRKCGAKQELSLPSGGCGDLWPAGRDEQQHDWEAPRTSQSGMGCTAHGYNFREDLLRALGNGVVEQTVELAFMDLLRKHFENGTEQNI